jgi:arsenate reductase-like glutaredoxin family protein
LSTRAASDIAKKKAAPLLARYEHITENEWTDTELDQWLDSLDEPHRNLIDDGVRTYRAKGFTNVSKLLCRLRRSAIHQEAVEQAQAPSLLHMLYEFNDERSKVEVHRAAQNFNKFFGQ